MYVAFDTWKNFFFNFIKHSKIPLKVNESFIDDFEVKLLTFARPRMVSLLKCFARPVSFSSPSAIFSRWKIQSIAKTLITQKNKRRQFANLLCLDRLDYDHLLVDAMLEISKINREISRETSCFWKEFYSVLFFISEILFYNINNSWIFFKFLNIFHVLFTSYMNIYNYLYNIYIIFNILILII